MNMQLRRELQVRFLEHSWEKYFRLVSTDFSNTVGGFGWFYNISRSFRLVLGLSMF